MPGTVKWCSRERGSLLSLPDPQQLLILGLTDQLSGTIWFWPGHSTFLGPARGDNSGLP